MNDKKERRTHSEELKQQIVQLYNIGKAKAEICRDMIWPTASLTDGSSGSMPQDRPENGIIEHRKKSNCSNCEKRTSS